MKIMKYSTKITLYNSYFDINERLTSKSILSIFQDIASIHAEEIGVGYEAMSENNLYWVLSRVKFDIIKMPLINQTVIVETWPHVKGRVDFDRDIRISSETGEVLIIGTSKWCVIDAVSRMLQRTENINYVGEYYEEVNYEDKFNKIIIPNDEKEEKFIYSVMFSDLDHNKHMNNTNYATITSNAINNKMFNHFEINFINECKLGDEICINLIKNTMGEYIIGIKEERIIFVSYVK